VAWENRNRVSRHEIDGLIRDAGRNGQLALGI